MIPDSAKESVAKAEAAVTKVSGIADDAMHKVDDVVDSLLPESTGTDLTFDAPFEEKISRLFVFRVLFYIPLYFIAIVWGFLFALSAIFHWFYMLILGKRNLFLWTVYMRFNRTFSKWSSYISGITDKRPDFIEG